jgi:cell pole-organizing protein PopZ
MEDILASIRRILSEDEPPAEAEGADNAGAEKDPAEKPRPAKDNEGQDPGVLVLDPSMMVEEPTPNAPVEQAMTEDAQTEPARPPEPTPQTVNSDAHGGGLVAPEAAAAAASSVGTLVRTLTGRSAQLHQGGPTLEDLVRDELRPILKQWLDVNLPPLVERLVRIEIERVVGRADI